MRATFFLTVALASQGCLLRASLRPVPPSDAVREARDVAYWQGDDFDAEKHRLDVYAPAAPGPHPVLVFVHGGGWILGDRQQLGGPYVKLGRRLAHRGVVALVISYRLAPGAKHPAQVRDVSRAVAWALEHAREYGGDPAATFVMGHSAGAQLAALTACDARWLKELGHVPSELAGVITVSGPYDVEHLGRSLMTGGPMVLPTFGRDPRVWRDAMPARHLAEGTPPPFFLAWADGDFEVVRRDARVFEQALKAAHVPVETLQTTFDDHFSIITDFADDGNVLGDRALAFISALRASGLRASGR